MDQAIDLGNMRLEPNLSALTTADLRGPALHERMRAAFIGLDTQYPLVDGRVTRRRYLDSAASTLMLRPAYAVTEQFLRHYASTHTQSHAASGVATRCYAWAHRQVLEFAGADPDQYVCVFAGAGATAALNRVAALLARRRPERGVVLASTMEHHSNDLPHRRHAHAVEHIRVSGEGQQCGGVDLADLDRLLALHGTSVNYVAVTAASNVTGVMPPIVAIAERAHAVGAWLVVDGAQIAAHAPFALHDPRRPQGKVDAFAFSGHKVYAPGSPGVLVIDRALLEGSAPVELGGGMVDDVFLERFIVTKRLPEREEAGTPNIAGAVTLGASLEVLRRIGMDAVRAHEAALLAHAWDRLRRIDGIRLYGPPPDAEHARMGTIAFNLGDLDHGLVAAALSDYCNVEVRNGCFCAHPYVRELLRPELWALDIDPDAPGAERAVMGKRGMVRASFGLYTTSDDVEALAQGLEHLAARPAYFKDQYEPLEDGNYRHRSRRETAAHAFDPGCAVADALGTDTELPRVRGSG
jgi:selenocysteine lyase/cysteine desulfurase